MITKELRMAATEINQILRYTEEKDVNKIPIGLRLFLKEIADEKYIPDINPEMSLENHKLLEETEQILGMIYYFYWSNENELDQIPTKVKEEAKEISAKYFQAYSKDSVFEDKKEKNKSSLAMVETQKVPWYKKFFAWFKRK